MKIVVILTLAILFIILIYSFSCKTSGNNNKAIPEDGYWDIALTDLPNPAIYCVAEVKNSCIVRLVTNKSEEWIFENPVKIVNRKLSLTYNNKKYTTTEYWTKTTAQAYELAKTQKERNEAEKKRLEEMYKPKMANKTWYGKVDVLENNIYIINQRPCKFELYNDKLFKLEYRGMKEKLEESVQVAMKLSYMLITESSTLTIHLVQNDQKYYEKEKGFGEKIANGLWTCKVEEKAGNNMKTKTYEGSCEVNNEKISRINYNEKSEIFEPPREIAVIVEIESIKNNPRYIIKDILAIDYYFAQDNNNGMDFSTNTNCTKCGKPKESTASQYCNSCDTKIKNTCPKCGKQEANAAIYWCSKCQKLKCPRCGKNVRSNAFDKYCSDCDRDMENLLCTDQTKK